jgi:hypothetical protein
MKCERLSLRFGVVLGLLVVLSTVPWARADDWEQSHLLQGVGFEAPWVRVGFNPQPEPPADWARLYFTDPTHPGLTGPVEEGYEGRFHIVFAISDMEPLTINAEGAPDDRGHFEFQVLGEAGNKMFDVFFDMGTSSGGVPKDASWVGFNPQPEPPGMHDGAGFVGFDFEFGSYSMATLEFQVFDTNSRAIGFEEVPEPTTLSMLAIGALGMLCLGGRRTLRRRRRSGAAG